MTEAKTTTTSKKFDPVTFWMADPAREEQIFLAGSRKKLKFRNGRLVVTTKEHYDLVKSLGIAHEEDGRKGKPHPVSGYNPGSYEAYEEHLNYIPSAAQG